METDDTPQGWTRETWEAFKREQPAVYERAKAAVEAGAYAWSDVTVCHSWTPETWRAWVEGHEMAGRVSAENEP